MADTPDRLEELTARLKERGYRLTPQRMAVLKVLLESKEHPTVEQVYERLKKDMPTTSLATVYKTVTVLKEMGEVLEMGFGDGSNRYDGNKPYPHPHLICIKCRRILDPDVAGWADLPQQIAERTGYRIVNHRLDFFGICPQCQAKETHAGSNTASSTDTRLEENR